MNGTRILAMIGVAFLLLSFQLREASKMLSTQADYKEELRQSKTFIDKEVLHLGMTYTVYSSAKNKVLDRKSAVLDKSKDNYFYQIGSVTLVQNEEFSLYIEESDKIIAIRESDTKKTNDLIGFDVAYNSYSAVTKSELNGDYVYELVLKEQFASEYSHVRLVVNKQSLKPKKLILFYQHPTAIIDENGQENKTRVKMEIAYTEIGESHNRSFSTRHFLKKTGDTFEGVGAYNGYRILDQRLRK